MPGRICVARFGAAHGVRGEVRLWSFTQDPAAVADYGPLETEDGKRRFEITAMRPAKDHFVVRVAGIDDRTAADALRNLDLYIARDRLPDIADDDTFYMADLIGLAAVSPDGVAIGTVTGVYNFGAGDLIEIGSDKGGDIMLSFSKAAVPEIDLAAKRIVVVLPTEIE